MERSLDVPPDLAAKTLSSKLVKQPAVRLQQSFSIYCMELDLWWDSSMVEVLVFHPNLGPNYVMLFRDLK